MVHQHARCLHEEVLPGLAQHGFCLLSIADVTEADDTDRFLVKLRRAHLQLGLQKFSGPDCSIRHDESLRGGDHETERMLGDRRGIGARGDRERDTGCP